MWKARVAALGAASLVALTMSAGAGAHAHGDSNKGDVWLDNAGQPPGPGHEMDPHLRCDDINLWGDKMADPSGTFTIDGWPPSGSREAVYSDQWNYDQAKGGDQVIASIDVAPLIQSARAHGDSAKNKNGFHFKLQLAQDPHKHKTFWVACTNSSFTSSNTRSAHHRRHRSTHHRSTRTTRRHRTGTTRTTHHRRRLSRRARRTRGFTG